MSPLELASESSLYRRFRAIYEALNEDRSWFGNAESLRFAALIAVGCAGTPVEVAAGIRSLADEIKAKSSWFGDLRSVLRFLVSALLLVHDDDAGDFLSEVKRVRELFRSERLRRSAAYETIAILILRLLVADRRIDLALVQRFKAMYAQMKSYHWWLTGPGDFPACALLAGERGSPEEIGRRVEEIYRTLAAQRFHKGDPLQTAAHILCTASGAPGEIGERFTDLARHFRALGVRIWQSDYDELAILCFLDGPASMVVDRTLEYRATVAELRPRPGRLLSFNFGASLAFLESCMEKQGLTDVKALLDMQAIINAQRAAAASAAAASSS